MAIDPSGVSSCICTTCVEPMCKPILDRSQNALSQKLDSFLFLEGNYRSLDREKEDLAAEASKLQRNMVREENMMNACGEDIKLLDGRIKVLQEDEIPSIADDYASMSRCLCRCTPNLIHRYKLGKRVSKHLTELRELFNQARDKSEVKLAYKPPVGAVEELETTWTVGITSKLNELKASVQEKHRKVIGVHGTGGVGKTTLLKEFNNDFLNGTCAFQVVIYVIVSNSMELNVEAIQRKISERLDLPWDDSQSQNARATTLFRVLRKKSFVLILDDVWKPFDLLDVGIPYPGDGINGKLILASRDRNVCIQMRSIRNNIKVETLKKEEAWSLFKNNLTEEAVKAVESDSVKPYAKKIVKLCKGLPLALNVIGKAVASTKSLDDWIAVSRMIKTSIAGLSDVDNKLLARLEISYTLLDDDLKPCFLYCSLFPEDYSISKDQLVEYWIAEGFIGDMHRLSLEEAYGQGLRNIQKLKDANLLETGDVESEIKMHDIIREMAIWVACNRGKKKLSLVQAGAGLTRVPMVNSWEVAERISLMNNSIHELHDSPQCNALLTLFLQSNSKLDRLPNNFFEFMPLLRVLDLSYTRIRELPIGEGALPELQHLNLRNTPISMLPNGLGSLQKLIHLDLSRTSSLVTVPNGVISRLSVLQVLNMYCSGYGEWIAEDRETNERGVQLKELEDLQELQALGITVQSVTVLNKLFDRHILKESTRYLGLEYCEDLDHIQISNFTCMTCLKELSIHSCHQLREFLLDEVTDNPGTSEVTDVEDDISEETSEASDPEDSIREETSLEVLTFASLSNLQSISGGLRPIPYLRRLRELTIKSCPKLENVSWVLQLHSLEKLTISDCDEIEQVVEEEREAERENALAFSKLETIRLKNLSKLKIICCARSFPSLKIVHVQGCPNLKKLPLGPSHDAKKLQKITGYDSWWKELEWEGGSSALTLGERNIFVPV